MVSVVCAAIVLLTTVDIVWLSFTSVAGILQNPVSASNLDSLKCGNPCIQATIISPKVQIDP